MVFENLEVKRFTRAANRKPVLGCDLAEKAV
jgi:hypothetical protein